MRIHHFYPKTINIGDSFVSLGIRRMIRQVCPQAEFQSFNVNARGDDRLDYGLTASSIERANREADLVIVGGSNLYEGRQTWGVSLEAEALERLRPPLFLMGIGVGSGFLASRPTRPSLRVRQEIVALNRKAYHSTVRDVSTLEWLENLGVKGVHLAGDPATFLFSSRLQTEGKGYVALVMPPRRYCPVGTRGRLDYRRWIMTNGLAFTARAISRRGYEVRILCNDHRDEGLARWLIPTLPSGDCVLPATPEEYFRCLSESRAVVAGRLHSAILSYSMGIPFVLIDVDMRTRGFVRTYDLEAWAPRPHFLGFRARLTNRVLELVEGGHRQEWQALIRRRDEMEGRAMTLLMHAVEGTLQRGG